jgi:hypothetical protein
LGDLLFNGIAPTAERSNLAGGLQADSSWSVNDNHTLRAGFLAQLKHTSSDTFSVVLPVDGTGAQTTNQPVGITDNRGKTGGICGVYIQDEWKILPALKLYYPSTPLRIAAHMHNHSRRSAADSRTIRTPRRQRLLLQSPPQQLLRHSPILHHSIDRPSNTRHHSIDRHASRDRRHSTVRPQPSVLHRHAKPLCRQPSVRHRHARLLHHGIRLRDRRRGMPARRPAAPAWQRRKARK